MVWLQMCKVNSTAVHLWVFFVCVFLNGLENRNTHTKTRTVARARTHTHQTQFYSRATSMNASSLRAEKEKAPTVFIERKI